MSGLAGKHGNYLIIADRFVVINSAGETMLSIPRVGAPEILFEAYLASLKLTPVGESVRFGTIH